jgi:hypothetical protein
MKYDFVVAKLRVVLAALEHATLFGILRILGQDNEFMTQKVLLIDNRFGDLGPKGSNGPVRPHDRRPTKKRTSSADPVREYVGHWGTAAIFMRIIRGIGTGRKWDAQHGFDLLSVIHSAMSNSQGGPGHVSNAGQVPFPGPGS